MAGVATIEKANRFLKEHWIRSGTSTSPWRPPIRRAPTVAAGRRSRSSVRGHGRAGRGTRLHGALEERLLADWAGGGRGGRSPAGLAGRRRAASPRASCACATAAGTWRPGRWAPPGLLRHPRRRVQGRSRRSRDRTIRGTGISARRSSAPSPSGSAATPPRTRRPERRGDPACSRPPGLGVQAPRLHPAPGPPRRPRSNPPPHQGEGIRLWPIPGHFYFGLTGSPLDFYLRLSYDYSYVILRVSLDEEANKYGKLYVHESDDRKFRDIQTFHRSHARWRRDARALYSIRSSYS